MDQHEPSPRGDGVRGLPLLLACLVLAGGALAVYFGYFRTAPPGPGTEPAALREAPVPEVARASGRELYTNHCSPCHGDKGDGNGPAARFLYPKPRNFQQARFRVVTTENLRPSDQDLLQVISRGMPGSAMLAFGHLPEADRKALAGYVRELTRAGLIEQQKAQGGDAIDLAELGREVDEALQPGKTLALPADFPAAGPESVARGTKLYQTEGCVSCHGATGKGDGAQEQKDDLGLPIRPRDFTRGIFKGGHEPQQLFARMLLGMPGTPMPASPKLKPADAGDLINFVLSLSDVQVRAKVEHRRVQIVAGRVPEFVSAEVPEATWDSARPTPVVVSPLWWRDYAEPDLQVAAVHDGKTLALRLTWSDASRNDALVRSEDFEDMAAVQLFKGQREPFLGMGLADQAVDVWQWRASGPGGANPEAALKAAHPNLAVDFYPLDQKEFLTAPAAGNLRSDPGRTYTGNSLQAKGFGTLTMRPRVSQLVSSRGTWKDGRWTVVLQRPLVVGPDGGLALAAGDRLSVGIALWDGAARDRNGQKLISVWHDLQLEK